MYSFWNGPVLILIGSLFSIFAFKGIIKADRINRNYFLSFILLLVAIVIHTKTSFFYSKYFSEYLSAILIGYVMLLSINTNSFLSAILNNALIVKTGLLSYSLYIWQELFIGGLPWQPWLSSWNGYPLKVIIILKLISVFLISSISYYFYESKFLRLKSEV